MTTHSSTNLYEISKYIVDTNDVSCYQTIQEAINIAQAAGGGVIYIRPGTYTENLTLYDGVNLIGAQTSDAPTAVTIEGTHQLPVSNEISIKSIYFTHTGSNIFTNAGPTLSDAYFEDCLFSCTDGHIFLTPQWSGTLIMKRCESIGSDNGIMDNTSGTMDIRIVDSRLGGSGTTYQFLLASGAIVAVNSEIRCTLNLNGSVQFNFDQGCLLLNTVNIRGSASGEIFNSTLIPSTGEAVNHLSSSTVVLSELTIDTSNDPAIDGNGTYTIGSITFLDNANYDSSLTLNRKTFNSGTINTNYLNARGEGTGTQNVIDITPDTAIAGSTWQGINIDGSDLDPTAGSAFVNALNIDLSGMDLTNDPQMAAVMITLPTTYTGDLCHTALRAFGWGCEVRLLCPIDNEAIFVDGEIHHDFNETGLVAGDTETGHDIVVNTGTSTGGFIHAIDVSRVGASAPNVCGIVVHPGLGVVRQLLGAFAGPSFAWKYDGVFTDVTAAFGSGASNVQIFVNDNDEIYIGSNAVFDQIEVALIIAASVSIKPVFEYSIVGPAWTTFSPQDDTQGFVQDGLISFSSSDLVGWVATTVNGQNYYWIRITRTKNALTTPPTEGTIKILSSTQYCWDSSGDLTVHDISCAAHDAASLTLDPGVSGDSYVLFQINDVDEFVMGVDDDDADALKINQGGATPSAGTNVWKMTAAGERTMPLQPAVCVERSSAQSNVTGDATSVLVLFNSERFDQNNDYNTGTGYFTAPVTGRYWVDACVTLQDLNANHTLMEIRIFSSNRTYKGDRLNPSNVRMSDNAASFDCSALIDMDAADTVGISLEVQGDVGKTVDIAGTAAIAVTYLEVALIC